LNNDATPAETDLTTDTRANYLMLLPQEVDEGDMEIEVKWTVNGGIPNSQTVGLPAQTWEPGYRYDYSLRVSLSGITLDPVQVNPWETPPHQPCTITYNANGGTDEDIVEHRVTGVEYPVGDYIFEREYYRFREEWNTEPDGKGTTYRAGEYITCTGDLTLYAQWRSTLPNCYMVKPAGDQVTFPVMLAYEDNGASTTLRIGGTHTGEFTIEEVWDPNDLVTATVTGEGPSATVTVTTASGSGNALVAIKAGSNIAWSYHIWVTDYEGDNTVTMYNGHVFMDRNLGATANDLSTAAYGLLYQWGRKDPFRNSGSIPIDVTSNEKGTIEYTIKHPDTFLTATSGTSYDWHYSSRNNYLWNQQTTNNKTIYDPCPAGWRVPAFKDNTLDRAYSPWREYDNANYSAELASRVWNNTGYEFTHKNNYVAFYPAAGYRYNTNGTCEYGGEYGRYWGAATTPAQYGGNTAYALSFRSGHVGYTLDYRASGFSVRCVQE
jgi:uncharacterized protein (TIGR02145 family)